MPQALGPGIFCHSPCFNRQIRNSADVVCVFLWGVGWELGILKVHHGSSLCSLKDMKELVTCGFTAVHFE